MLFIVIDENGGVESAIITEPLDRMYDAMLLAATKTWTYRPATLNGVAVKYRKRSADASAPDELMGRPTPTGC